MGLLSISPKHLFHIFPLRHNGGMLMERIIKDLEDWLEYMNMYTDKQYQKGKIRNLLEYTKTKQNNEMIK